VLCLVERSANGQKIVQDVREILQAYKQLGNETNNDDQLQEAIWHLSQAAKSDKVSLKTDTPNPSQQVSEDAQAFSDALLTIFKVATTQASSESGSILEDLASFTRNVLADAAEILEETARDTKTSLRETEGEVQEGKRDAVGLTEEQKNMDAQQMFEAGMDTAKVAGSKTIGAGQQATAKASEISNKTGRRLRQSADQFLRRTQHDPKYRDAISTIFDLGDKWLDRAVSTIDQNQNAPLESFIDDPTGHVHLALQTLGKFIQRLSGGKKPDDISNAIRKCVVDIRSDPSLRQFLRDLSAHMKKVLRDTDYLESEASEQKRKELARRWDELTDMKSEKGQQWKGDVNKLEKELQSFASALKQNKALMQLRDAHTKFGQDLASILQGKGQEVVQNAQWMWADFFDVVIPRVLAWVQSVPVPRTEYKSDDVDFVVENLDLSTFSLLPGHAKISNTTDMDVDKASTATSASTDVSSHTHIHLTGIQLAARNVAFWYHDKTASTFSELSGIIDLILPQKGLDVDIKFSLRSPTAPSAPPAATSSGKVTKRTSFHKLESVHVDLNDLEIKIVKSSSPVLTTLFRPILLSRVAESIRQTLEQHLSFALRFADHIAYDISERAQVFSDAGLPTSAAYMSGLWSEIGRFSHSSGGLWAGASLTAAGIVVDDPTTDYKIAIGAQPQLFPNVTRAKPSAGPTQDVDMEGAKEEAKGAVAEAKGAAQQIKREVQTFNQLVEKNSREAKGERGWKSDKFNVSA